MYNFILALKRAVRTVYFPVLLAVFAVALYFAPTFGRGEAVPPSGICDYDKSITSERIVKYLTENNFVVCDDEAQMLRMVSGGEYDCGVIIPKGFEERMAALDMEQSIIFYESPLSYAPNLVRGHVSSAVFGEYTPYLTADTIKELGVTLEDVLEHYRIHADMGALFSFNIETVNSVVSEEDERALAYTFGIASLLIFAVLMYAACDLLSLDIVTMAPRIGMKKVLFGTVIPGMAVRVVGVLAAALVAASAAFEIRGDALLFSVLPAVCIYTVLIASWALLCTALFADTAKIQVFTFFILLLSLILCPIYLDASILIKWVEYFRYLIMPYWLWVCNENILSALLILPALAIAFGSLYLKFTKKPIR